MDKLSQANFLTTHPPSGEVEIVDFEKTFGNGNKAINFPHIEMFCQNCNGMRFYEATGSTNWIGASKHFELFAHYTCRNCKMMFKTFALRYHHDSNKSAWVGAKYGERPPFGPHTPSRVISLIGPDRDEFLQGRRCENQGLGVAAFVYYRRVVERQKNRLLERIANVAAQLGGNDELVAEIERAKAETQFTKAIESIRHALPQSLLINGQNPLTLLYNALSQGVHNLTDEQCLSLAHSVRVVLVEFSDKLSEAIKNEDEINNAIKLLQNPGAA